MKKVVSILILCFLIWACNDNNKIAITESINNDSLQNTTRPVIGLIYETENMKLYGDTTVHTDKISYALIKFEPYVGFDDFEVSQIDNKKYADLDLKSLEGANYFRTTLREGYASDTANFAGHYTFVYWGCGSNCLSSMLIDRKTGKIYDSPSASGGYDFRANSKMIIVNPPDDGSFFFDCTYCKPIIYIFDEKTKTFNELKQK